MRCKKTKAGFGILEVVAAAVVLGFLMVALLYLQMGNRESILRVRARDAANFIANHVLDSLSGVGINSFVNTVVYSNENYVHSFDGAFGEIKISYDVKVEMLPEDANHKVVESTMFSTQTNTYNKKLEATVSWQHRNSTQSIKIAKVVR